MIKASAKAKSRSDRAKPGDGKRSARDLFWRKTSHVDLDRAGDFILENLGMIREEATVRGDPR